MVARQPWRLVPYGHGATVTMTLTEAEIILGVGMMLKYSRVLKAWKYKDWSCAWHMGLLSSNFKCCPDDGIICLYFLFW